MTSSTCWKSTPSVEAGQLTLTARGVWEFYPDRVADAPEAGLNEEDAVRLGQAALAGPSKLDFLAALWRTSGENARGTVDRGRALGYLRTVDPADPDNVQFTDSDQAAAVSMRLTGQQRTDAHAYIAELLERATTTTADSGERASRDLAYHFSAAGELERAAQYAQIIQLMTPTLIAPQVASLGGTQDTWDMPPVTELAKEDEPLVIDAAMTLRLAGVQLRLYPPNSEIVRRTIGDAVTALDKLFTHRPALTISYDGHTVAFDGQVFQRRDLQLVLKDYQTWMTDGHLRAIGVTAGITEEELTRFLQTLTMGEVVENDTPLGERLMALSLENIKLLGHALQHNVNAMGGGGGGGQPAWNQGALPPGTVNVPMGLPRMLPPELLGGIGHPGAESATTLPPQLQALLNESNAAAVTADMRGQNPPPLKLDTMSADEWRELSGMMSEANARARRVVMNGLVRMLREAPADATPLPSAMDGMLTQRVQQEMDTQVLRETLQATERRMEGMTTQHNWEGMSSLLDTIRRRLERETNPEVVTQLNDTLDHIGTDTAMRGLIDESVQQPDNLERVRRVVSQLGGRALRPLIAALKNATSIQERARLMQLLREFGNIELPLLLQELRENNPWYVYRNLLQVLAEVGNEDALGAVSKMIHHADPRVRSEAVMAAVRIAREKAAPYLLEGMNDDVPDVRARAVSLVGICPQPNIEEQVLRLLQPRMGREEPPGVQLAAALALGHFDTDSARDVLLQILYPRLFSPYRKKSDDVRSAAVAALAEHLEHKAVQHGIQQATRDRASIVRQTAQRIWQQHLIYISTQPME